MGNGPMCQNTVPQSAAPPEPDENPAVRKDLGLELHRSATTYGQQLDRYGGFLDVKGKQTGFFHTERINDRWWLVTPDGHGFFGIGLSHPITNMSEAAITFAYGGSQEEWMRDGIRQMRALGFNCVWSGPYSLERIPSGNIDTDLADGIYRKARIPYAIHVPLIKHQVELKPGEKRLDVFSARYRRLVGEEITRRVAPTRTIRGSSATTTAMGRSCARTSGLTKPLPTGLAAPAASACSMFSSNAIAVTSHS